MVMPSHQPTEQNRRTVESMSGYGIPHVEIARVVGIDTKTLRKHYRDELDTGPVKANAKVAESLFLQATGAPAVYDSEGRKIRDEQPRVPSTGIWWTKARMGWKEVVKNEVTGEDGGPQKHTVTHKLSADVRALLAEATAGLSSGVDDA